MTCPLNPKLGHGSIAFTRHGRRQSRARICIFPRPGSFLCMQHDGRLWSFGVRNGKA